MFLEYADIVNVDTMCKMLGIGKSKAYSLIRENKIRALRIGRKVKIPKKEIVRYVEVAIEMDK